MAKETLKRLEEQLNCSICLDTYTDPKLLQCFHVYCQQCLVPLAAQDQQGQLSLTCPTCRRVTPLPDRGVAGLQSAFHINHLLKILEGPAKDTPDFSESSTVQNPVKKASDCIVHADKELELYCDTCEELICCKCGLKGGSHYDNEYKDLNLAFERYKEDIKLSLKPIENQAVIIKQALQQFEKLCGDISDQQTSIEDTIHVTFRRLRETLNIGETELIGQLHKSTEGKLKVLAVQRDKIETTLAQINSCLTFMRKSIQTGIESDVLAMKSTTMKKVRELSIPFHAGMLKPSTEADMVFSTSADMTWICQNYGQVFAPGSPDPLNCHTTGKALEVAMVGERCTVQLETFNFRGKPCEDNIKSLECELTSTIMGTRTNCSIEKKGQNQYNISYQPIIKGRNQLHIKVDNQYIRGSPFSLLVISSMEKLGTPILNIDKVLAPFGVVINQKEEMVVTENIGHCVSVFSPNGDKLRSFGTSGCGQGQFLDPRGVAVDGEGNILVAGGQNHRIQKFTSEGRFLAVVGTEGSGLQEFSTPIGIAFNASNNRTYVMDSGNNRVQVLNSDLTFSSTFGKQGTGKGQFDCPCGVACNSTGEVYVADTCNDRIQVFTPEGKFLRTFGRHGQDRGKLAGPCYIAVGGTMVYVSEYGNNRVSVFTSEGKFVTSFGRKGAGPGKFDSPVGLAVDSSGVVYVCDHDNHRIQLF